MTQTVEKIETKAKDTLKTNLVIGVYSIYDCVLKQFGAPISIPDSKVNDYFTMLVNDVQSPYYNHESDYILNRIGTFNPETGEIELHFVERVCIMDSFINDNMMAIKKILKKKHNDIKKQSKIKTLF